MNKKQTFFQWFNDPFRLTILTIITLTGCTSLLWGMIIDVTWNHGYKPKVCELQKKEMDPVIVELKKMNLSLKNIKEAHEFNCYLWMEKMDDAEWEEIEKRWERIKK